MIDTDNIKKEMYDAIILAAIAFRSQLDGQDLTEISVTEVLDVIVGHSGIAELLVIIDRLNRGKFYEYYCKPDSKRYTIELKHD